MDKDKIREVLKRYVLKSDKEGQKLIDKMADEICEYTNKALKAQREEITKEINKAIAQAHGGGNGRRLLEQLRDNLTKK